MFALFGVDTHTHTQTHQAIAAAEAGGASLLHSGPCVLVETDTVHELH